jgi:hypothetical protein
MIAQDPSDKVREKVTFGLSVSKVPAALTTLISTAREDRSTRVRGQALFWLAQKAGKEAVATITNAIDNDPETEVKKKAVSRSASCQGRRRSKTDGSGTHQLQPGGANRRCSGSVRRRIRARSFFEDILLKK